MDFILHCLRNSRNCFVEDEDDTNDNDDNSTSSHSTPRHLQVHRGDFSHDASTTTTTAATTLYQPPSVHNDNGRDDDDGGEFNIDAALQNNNNGSTGTGTGTDTTAEEFDFLQRGNNNNDSASARGLNNQQRQHKKGIDSILNFLHNIGETLNNNNDSGRNNTRGSQGGRQQQHTRIPTSEHDGEENDEENNHLLKAPPLKEAKTTSLVDTIDDIPTIALCEVVMPGSLLQKRMSDNMKRKGHAGESEEDECVICMEGFDSSNPRMPTLCGCGANKTYFHLPCLYHWIEQSRDCPSCRKKLTWQEF